MLTVHDFIKASENSVILFHGLEYLVTRYGFLKVLKFFQDLNEVIVSCNSRVIVPTDPRTLEDREIALLEGEMEIIPSK